MAETNEEVLRSSNAETRTNSVSINAGEGGDNEGEREVEKFVSFMTKNLRKHRHSDYPSFYLVSIYKVPKKLRKVNEEGYSPRLVSIGPIHHGRKHLKAMEAYKWRCLDRFLWRSGVDLDRIARAAMENERYVRECYHDTFDNFSKQEFAQMIYLDCIFILELFLETYLSYGGIDDVSKQKIFVHEWMKRDLLHDMLLLENQIPLRKLIGTLGLIKNYWQYDLAEIVNCYFKNVGITYSLKSDIKKVDHLVHFLLDCYRPSVPREEVRFKEKVESIRSASELKKAGVKFQGIKGNNLFEIDFSKGTLTIPRLIVNEWTGTLFRNLIAYEHCERNMKAKDITSYVFLMDSLIDTPEDVAILVKSGIIKNQLGTNERVSELFNNIHKETAADENDFFYFARLCEELNKYSRDPLHQLQAKLFGGYLILRRDYCTNMWTTVSVIAAVILLVLTVVQTVYSIKAA